MYAGSQQEAADDTCDKPSQVSSLHDSRPLSRRGLILPDRLRNID
jgi:hypothetical protein